MESTHEHGHSEEHGKAPGSRAKWVFVAFLGIAAFFLFTEHRAHFFGILPYLLLLACPLMHFFHHHGHGGHKHGEPEGEKK